jgi:hypothetical protein
MEQIGGVFQIPIDPLFGSGDRYEQEADRGLRPSEGFERERRASRLWIR